MREIKFRGLPTIAYEDRNWVYGNAVLDYEEKIAYIDTPGGNLTQVDWETVVQFTGLKDKNGTEIYEGDIVELGTKERFYVAWHDYKQEFTFRGYGGGYYPNTYRGATRDDEYGWKVIGNIHEHSHLLEEVRND